MGAGLLKRQDGRASGGMAGRYPRQLPAHRRGDDGHGPNIGMPHTRAMGGGLFEVRAKGSEGIGRAFYCTVVAQRIVILHAIVKKPSRPRRAIWIRHAHD